MTPIKLDLSHIPISTENYLTSITRSDTFNTKAESPSPPQTGRTSTTKSINRSGTFHKEPENVLSPVPVIQSVETIPAALTNRSSTFVSKSETPPLPPENILSTDFIPTFTETRSDTFISRSEDVPSSNEKLPIIDPIPTHLPSSLEQFETIPMKLDISSTPRLSTPPKVSVEGKHPIKTIYSFINEARHWAEHTRDITYSHLLLSTEEIIRQLPIRKTGGTLRKLPDIDSQILIKAAGNQSSNDKLHYLLLEQLLMPCSLSLISMTYPNLTHLTLRQCKLIQLVGLDSCSSLTALDIEVINLIISKTKNNFKFLQ